MAPIGLAHRPIQDVPTRSGHGDPDQYSEPSARLHEHAQRAIDEVQAATTADRSEDTSRDEPSLDGWLAGEPMF